MDQKEICMLSSTVYFAVASDRYAFACNKKMREVQAVEGMVQSVCSFVLLLWDWDNVLLVNVLSKIIPR